MRWNSEAGKVSGVIVRVHTQDTDYKGHTHRCSPDDPQYEIQSDKTEHIALCKGSALEKCNTASPRSQTSWPCINFRIYRFDPDGDTAPRMQTCDLDPWNRAPFKDALASVWPDWRDEVGALLRRSR